MVDRDTWHPIAEMMGAIQYRGCGGLLETGRLSAEHQMHVDTFNASAIPYMETLSPLTLGSSTPFTSYTPRGEPYHHL